MILLDTNICIHIIKRKPASVLEHFMQHQPGDIGISAITLAELQFGVAKSQAQKKNQNALDEFLLPLEVLPFSESATHAYGQIRANLERRGTPIGANDLLIAAHALSLGALLVTNNTREFERIPGLQFANWIE
jgi:tRNA(fMet)-specific endonuclease VapC